jgi:choline-sulfatase
MKQPNILFLMSDQHTAELMGCAGASFVRTPNLDRLAAQGVRFTNAYCNYPHCVPSRASLMTGLQCHRLPCYDNGSTFRSDLPTWAHLLTRAGYHTVLDGKMHFIGEDQHHGFQVHVNEVKTAIAAFRWGTEKPDPTTGTRYWADLHFEGDPVYEKRAKEEAERLEYALAYLREPPTDQPFCLVLSFVGPHYPQCCTRALFDSYAGTPIPEPLGPEGLHPRHQHWLRCWGLDRFSPAQTRGARQAYLAMITQVDAWYGQVLAALEASGKGDETIIIYCSDHGEMWGEHGLWGKQVFFEESAKVPLIVSAPALGIRQGVTVETPVSLLDLHATLSELAGITDVTVPTDGRSLVPALTGSAPLADQPVISEYYGPDTRGPERMVRFRQYKLNYYHQQGLELFDLARDPRELKNLVEDAAYQGVREQLWAMLIKDWDPATVDRQARIDQDRRTVVTACFPGAIKAL